MKTNSVKSLNLSAVASRHFWVDLINKVHILNVLVKIEGLFCTLTEKKMKVDSHFEPAFSSFQNGHDLRRRNLDTEARATSQCRGSSTSIPRFRNLDIEVGGTTTWVGRNLGTGREEPRHLRFSTLNLGLLF